MTEITNYGFGYGMTDAERKSVFGAFWLLPRDRHKHTHWHGGGGGGAAPSSDGIYDDDDDDSD